jgi:uncharacterized protein (TIGR02145 family)
MQYVTTEGIQGICPTGWHIPTNAELFKLGAIVYHEANVLRGEGTGFTNTSGFSGLLAGCRWYDGTFGGVLGWDSYFWSSTLDDEGWTTSMELDVRTWVDDTIGYVSLPKTVGASVRCAKD